MINLFRSGELLHKAAKDSKYSVAEIARMMNVTTQAMYRWFRGESLPSIDNLFLFAEIVGCSVEDIVAYKAELNRSAA